MKKVDSTFSDLLIKIKFKKNAIIEIKIKIYKNRLECILKASLLHSSKCFLKYNFYVTYVNLQCNELSRLALLNTLSNPWEMIVHSSRTVTSLNIASTKLIIYIPNTCITQGNEN